MAIDNSFIIKKLQGLPEMFVIFSQSTKHPYVTCNEESFDDQIHIFSDAEAAHAYVVAKNEQEKIPVVSVRVAAEQFLHFYGTLYALGVNGVVLHDNDTETSLALEAIVHRRHNPDELPEKQRPVINPELMLTSLYFLQEMRRPVSEEEKEKAYEEIQKAKEVIGDYPIAVDYQAVLRPYNLALMMSRNGFHMGMVASDSVSTFEKPSFEALKKEDPEVLIENPMSHNAVKFPHEGEKYLCIGFDCGYMTGSDRVADLMEDEGMFGFYGTRRLMEMLREAYRSKADVREMIVKAGLII